MSDIPSDRRSELDREFTEQFGRALLQWARVEDSLFQWFRHLTKMRDAPARAIFYSARSFKARSEMLRAVIAVCRPSKKLWNEDLNFIKDAVAKADMYSGFRNALAHGIAYFDDLEDQEEIIILNGKIRWVDRDKLDSVRSQHIHVATDNFCELHYLMTRYMNVMTRAPVRSGLLREFHELLVRLPNQPSSRTLSQNQLGRLRQQKLAQTKASPKADR